MPARPRPLPRELPPLRCTDCGRNLLLPIAPPRSAQSIDTQRPAPGREQDTVSHVALSVSAFCAFCGYSPLPRVVTTARFALFHAAMPPTTFDTFRKPNCSSRLVAIDER